MDRDLSQFHQFQAQYKTIINDCVQVEERVVYNNPQHFDYKQQQQQVVKFS